LDLHRFKEVNDRLGHPRGDDVLRAVASTLRKSLRTSDAAYRIGGDEFALILPQTDAAQALALSKRVSIVFSEVLRPLNISVRVSLDHGVATFPMDAEQSEELIQIADARLYRLKHANHLEQSAQAKKGSTPDANPSPIPAPPAEVQSSSQTSSTVKPEPVPGKPEAASPLEVSPSASDATETTLAAAVSASTQKVHTLVPPSGLPQSRPNYTVQRKAERVSMTGTNAYAVLGESSSRRAKVLDLGFGGVALELDSKQDLPENFLAVLHVPILPPVRVNLRPVWSRATAEGSLRIGCRFIS
jgi:diguanylate cyclase (GGDEF)-like protein